jgi:2-polyprenyl-6-methoxyphenol hydroxylase-like FAD-dependent oxidoreductase
MGADVIIVGGGLAGSTLATALARGDKKVLVLEQETQFKDRVRGENMLPWGVAVARRLGLVECLLAAGGHRSPYWVIYIGGNPISNRDLHATVLGLRAVSYSARRGAPRERVILREWLRRSPQSLREGARRVLLSPPPHPQLDD